MMEVKEAGLQLPSGILTLPPLEVPDSWFLRWGCRGHPYSGLVSYRHGALGGPPPLQASGPGWAAPQLICGRGWPGRPRPRPPAPPTRLGSQRRALSILLCLQPLPSPPPASPGLGAAAEGLAWVRSLQRCPQRPVLLRGCILFCFVFSLKTKN